MMNIPTLQAWKAGSWQAVAQAFGTKQSSAHSSATLLRTQASVVRNSASGSLGQAAAKQLEDQAASLEELSGQFKAVKDAVDGPNGAIAWIGDSQRKLSEGLDWLSGKKNVEHDDDGFCVSTAKNDFWNPFDDWDAWWAHQNALIGTQKLRNPLWAADRNDYEASRMVDGMADLPVPTPTDGPLDLSNAGLRYQTELNNQDRYGDCVSLSSLISIVNSDPNFIREHLKWDDKAQEYIVTLYDHGNPVDVHVKMSEIKPEGSNFPGSNDPSFQSIYEVALDKQFHDIDKGQHTHTPLERITGNKGDSSIFGPPSFDKIHHALNQQPPGLVVVASSGRWPVDMKQVDPSKHIESAHAYSVKGFDSEGRIIVINPWGPGGGYDEKGNYYPGEVHLTQDEFNRYFSTGTVMNSY